MKIIYGIENINIKSPTVAAIGIFDGIHRGHKKILRLLRQRAAKAKAKSCVLTFDPHPSKVLQPDKVPPMLISTRHRLNLLKSEGVDIVILIKFTEGFAGMEPGRFVEDVLVGKMNIKELLVGRDFLFGRNRSGSVGDLRQLGESFNFKVHSVEPLKSGRKIISSTFIRKLAISGKLKEAARMLGREVSILGTVREGSRRGRLLGFPTANLDPHHEAIPPSGVYIVKVRLANKEYGGILNIGFQPTFNKKKSAKDPTIEVHIFNFRGQIYGKDLEIIFLKRIRSERGFKNQEQLLARIRKDADIAEGYLNKACDDQSTGAQEHRTQEHKLVNSSKTR